MNTQPFYKENNIFYGNVEFFGTLSKVDGSDNNILLESGHTLNKNSLATNISLNYYLKKDASNEVTEDFAIVNDGSSLTINNYLDYSNNYTTSNEGNGFRFIVDSNGINYFHQKQGGGSTIRLLNRGIHFMQKNSSETKTLSSYILKSNTDNLDSHLYLPNTGTTSRRLAISVNGIFANDNGTIPVNATDVGALSLLGGTITGNLSYSGVFSKVGGSANNILLESGHTLNKTTLATTAQLNEAKWENGRLVLPVGTVRPLNISTGAFEIDLLDVCPTINLSEFINWDITWETIDGAKKTLSTIKTTGITDKLDLNMYNPSGTYCVSLSGIAKDDFTIPSNAKLILYK